jgi:hypothetical protein
MYKLSTGGVIRQADNAFIPDAAGNRDWIEYQEWLSAGNVPAAADVIDPWIEIRSTRNSKLSNCDWTQLPDSPLDTAKKTEWLNYRQELRDITLQSDPNNIVWPTEPV